MLKGFILKVAVIVEFVLGKLEAGGVGQWLQSNLVPALVPAEETLVEANSVTVRVFTSGGLLRGFETCRAAVKARAVELVAQLADCSLFGFAAIRVLARSHLRVVGHNRFRGRSRLQQLSNFNIVSGASFHGTVGSLR